MSFCLGQIVTVKGVVLVIQSVVSERDSFYLFPFKKESKLGYSRILPLWRHISNISVFPVAVRAEFVCQQRCPFYDMEQYRIFEIKTIARLKTRSFDRRPIVYEVSSQRVFSEEFCSCRFPIFRLRIIFFPPERINGLLKGIISPCLKITGR